MQTLLERNRFLEFSKEMQEAEDPDHVVDTFVKV